MKDRMKIFFFTISLFFLFETYLHAQEPTRVFSETYTIKKGDTLWDISEKFLSDPFRWPEVWKLNPFVADPDLIFPGETLNLKPKKKEIKAPTVEEAIKIEVKEEVVEEEIEEVKPMPLIVAFPPEMLRVGFISRDKLEETGIILASKEGTVLMAEGDMVYLKTAKGIEAQNGDRFTIFDDLGEVTHPLTGESMGQKIEILGTLEILEKSEDLYVAKIIDSHKEILKGVRTMSYKEPTKEVVIKKGETPIDGIILSPWEDKVLIAERDIVLIDKGQEDGLEVGNILTIYRVERDIPDLSTTELLRVPMREIGTLLVVDTQRATSTGLVTKSERSISKGDMVRSCGDCNSQAVE